jgi:hypothetical protein
MSAKAFTARISFSQDSIELSSFWNRRSKPLAAIVGRREYVVEGDGESGSTRYLRLEFNDGSPPMDFGKHLYRFDEFFSQWFNELPDLDARDKANEESDKAKHKDSNFGLV